MFDTQTLATMREELKTRGVTSLVDQHGKRIVLTSGALLNWGPVLVVAYEGQGCMVYDIDRPMTPYRAIKSGFGFGGANAVSELLNQLVGNAPAGILPAKADPEAKATPKAKALTHAPKGST